jgi:uncharacterized protein (DUF4415 family)
MTAFEWDEAKRALNLEKHGLDFRDARKLFDGRAVISVPARTASEARFLTIGKLCGDRFYTVVWAQRGDARRIITRSGDRGMKKKRGISRYTAEELEALAREKGSRSDWNRANSKTYAEIEADAAADEAEDGMTIDWTSAQIGLPEPKAVLHMRIDRDVLDFFKRGGRGYQTRINAVLRAYKDAHTPRR